MEIVGQRHRDAIVASGDGAVKPARQRSHKRSRPQLLTRAELDGRTNAAKFFDALAANIEADLGGRDRLSFIERELIEGFCGSAVSLRHLNTKLARGEPIDIGELAQCVSALVKVASRLGLKRRMVDRTPTLSDILRRPPT